VRLVSPDSVVAARMRRLLDGRLEVIAGLAPRGALEAGSAGPPDLVLLDLASLRLDPEEVAAVRRRATRPFLVGLVPAEEPLSAAVEQCDLVLARDLPDAALRLAIEQGLRVRRLELEIASLRRERERHEAGVTVPGNGHTGGGPLGTVLKEMGKLLAAHFDLERVVDFFLDAITELVRPGRVALLLLGEDHQYRIRSCRGLDPALAEQLRLAGGEGLPAWLRQHARLAVRRELEREPEWLEAAAELARLGGEVAVPLWVQAKLVGVLTLGPRVTGQPYGPDDLERLFTLAGQVAIAVEDISLFNTVRTQHAFIEQVLAHLGSGAITIDTAGCVTRLNRRAAEILGLTVPEVVGHDLRTLPSPLGDLLYDTVRTGRELRREDVQLPRHQATLEVSTSRILDAAGSPSGAVMVFDDPMPRHLLQRERQASQTLDLLNRVLLRLTDEIKNPLVSIYTFLELLPQRYEDPEFRETFLSVVGKDTQRLISLVDKLITLAGEREYKLELCDLHELLTQALEEHAIRFERGRAPREATLLLLETPERRDHVTALLYAPDSGLVVRADREQLTKALGYLIRFLANRVEPGGRIAFHLHAHGGEQAARLAITGRPATLPPQERERLFSPLAIASDKLFDVGPGVSQKIIEAHGGTLTLGGGEDEIRFIVALPRTQP
jgi:PAS domain S-box-containing protein